MDVRYDGQNAFTAAANGDFPLVVLIWGMAMAVQPAPVDLLTAVDDDGNSIMHHAAATALEGNTSIVHFLIQQTQATGRSVAAVVDARNTAGETPLIRAAHVGNLRVLDTLVKFGGADIHAEDREGNTALHHAAAEGQLWVLHYLLEAESSQKASAASSYNRALYFACEGEHKVVVQYLLSRGFDANATDYKGTSALQLARNRKLSWLVELLESRAPSFTVSPTKCRQTRLWLVLVYGLMLFAVLSSSYYLPWWIAVPLIVLIMWKSLSRMRAPRGHGHSHGGSKDVESLHPSKRDIKVTGSVALSTARPHVHRVSPTLVQTVFSVQPELIVGVWAGWVFTFLLFHAVVWLDASYAFIVEDARPLLIALVPVEVIFLCVWARLAAIYPSDPGTITTFESDVTKMLADAKQGVPPSQVSHCRTCFVHKPLRSKHCAQCGVCVARMDHHCGWINRCVGYGNHRLFMVFLTVHILVISGYVGLVLWIFQRLLRPGNLAAASGSAPLRVWIQVPSLVSHHLLAVLVLIWGVAAVVALVMMLVQHLGNIAKNLTINEQINWKRYAYLKQAPPAPGKKPILQNTFDRGVATNTAEFWRRSGPSALDYRTVFHVAALDGPSQPLTAPQDELV